MATKAVRFKISADKYYEKNPLMQRIGSPFTSSGKALSWLEIHKQEFSSLTTKKKAISYSYLMQALVYGKKIYPSIIKQALNDARSMDFYCSNQDLQLIAEPFNQPKKLIDWLEEDIQKFWNSKTNQPYTFGFIGRCLSVGGKIKFDKKLKIDPITLTCALDFFHKAEVMQTLEGKFDNYLPAIYWIIDKQSILNSIPQDIKEEKKHSSIAFYMLCLYAGGKLTGDNPMNLIIHAGAADLFLNNKILNTRKEPFADCDTAIDWLIEQRVEIGSKNKKFCGLVYLMRALAFGKLIPAEKVDTYCSQAGAADYALQHRALFQQELARLHSQGIKEQEINCGKFDLTLFPNTKNPQKSISLRYFRKAKGYAWKYYGREYWQSLN
jgi:hypothetical protein